MIGDYNHVFGTTTDPGLFPGAGVPRRVVVVVDEAHNLLDRAREHDSVFLSRRALEVLARVRRRKRRSEPALFDVVFTNDDVTDYRSFMRADGARLAVFNRCVREKGILKSPNKIYPSVALTEGDLELTTDAIAYAAQRVALD